jgi:small subunit ribosomal protein S2
MKALLETGVHFGHRTQKWNPKMAPYIFTERNGIHIIDLQQTLAYLNQYHDMIVDMVANGGTVLFVGTKRQAQDTVAKEATRCGMPYVTHRWLGGTLTNWRTIHERINTLKKLESRREKGELDLLTKKERLMMERKIEKLQLRLGGIRDMQSLPSLLIAVDSRREETAVKEANILKIPVLAFLDTNSNPDVIDYIIPANDDAMRSIKLLVAAMADAVLEGKAMRKQDDFEEELPDEIDLGDYVDGDEEDDERYLGESTLAKLRDAKLFADEDEDKAEDKAEAENETEAENEQDEDDK